MATIITINKDNTLEDLRQVHNLPYEHDNHLFAVEHKLTWSKFQIKLLKDKNAGSDVFSCKEYNTNPHWHFSAEERLILSGRGKFFIPTNDKLYIIEVESGDLVWLSPCLQHWFETTGIMSARFFAEDNAHIEQKNNIETYTLDWYSKRDTKLGI